MLPSPITCLTFLLFVLFSISSCTGGDKTGESSDFERVSADHNKARKILLDSFTQIAARGEDVAPIAARLSGLDSTYQLRMLQAINDGPKNLEGAINLGRIMRQLPADSVELVYAAFPEQVKSSAQGERIRNYLATTPLGVGEIYADFSAFDEQDSLVQFSDLKGGDKTILFFTSITCAPCKVAVKELDTLLQEDISLTVVSLYGDKDKEKWRADRKEDVHPWAKLIDPAGIDATSFLQYGIKGFPGFVILDAQGTVTDRWMGYGNGLIRKVLDEPGFMNAE